MTNLNETLIKVIEEAEKRGLGHFGLRAEDKIFEIGASLERSYQSGDTWNDEELEGTCAVKLYSYDGFEVDEDLDEDLENVKVYLQENRKVILVGGTNSYEGTDAHETVISNAEVLYVF